jgi:hypothetical protein
MGEITITDGLAGSWEASSRVRGSDTLMDVGSSRGTDKVGAKYVLLADTEFRS